MSKTYYNPILGQNCHYCMKKCYEIHVHRVEIGFLHPYDEERWWQPLEHDYHVPVGFGNREDAELYIASRSL